MGINGNFTVHNLAVAAHVRIITYVAKVSRDGPLKVYNVLSKEQSEQAQRGAHTQSLTWTSSTDSCLLAYRRRGSGRADLDNQPAGLGSYPIPKEVRTAFSTGGSH